MGGGPPVAGGGIRHALCLYFVSVWSAPAGPYEHRYFSVHMRFHRRHLCHGSLVTTRFFGHHPVLWSPPAAAFSLSLS